ncbi:hypothetical protein PIB30_057134 [Stylosanthes scabra]|uniref:Histidine-containing phosphotransfer protein n=1 Tax=Stylosanthes scabra TaxID=79078 RepID=A0ABU6TK49_9FABA|nr:hypothetical protein [Stylosanthes scabra]
MAMAILYELLQGYINSLHVEGLVNDQFLSLINTEELECVVEMIEKYFEHVDGVLPELSCEFDDNSEVDDYFSKFASLVREVEEKSTSIGAEHMRLACSVLIKACEEKNERK